MEPSTVPLHAPVEDARYQMLIMWLKRMHKSIDKVRQKDIYFSLNQNFMLICISTWYVPHNYIALRNSVERLQRRWADKTNRTDGFSFWTNFQVKKGRYSEKKMNQISCEYAHLHIMSFITTKFYDIMLSGFRGGALTRKTGLPD